MSILLPLGSFFSLEAGQIQACRPTGYSSTDTGSMHRELATGSEHLWMRHVEWWECPLANGEEAQERYPQWLVGDVCNAVSKSFISLKPSGVLSTAFLTSSFCSVTELMIQYPGWGRREMGFVYSWSLLIREFTNKEGLLPLFYLFSTCLTPFLFHNASNNAFFCVRYLLL